MVFNIMKKIACLGKKKCLPVLKMALAVLGLSGENAGTTYKWQSLTVKSQ